MRQYCFNYEGRQYNIGTVVIIKSSDCCGHPCQKEASFLYHDVEQKRFVFKIEDVKYYYLEKHLQDKIINITDKVDQKAIDEVNQIIARENRTPTLQDEFNIDGLFIAWMWYIIIMLVSIIFKDRVLAWVGVSIVFFNYRKEKLRKAGFKK